MVNIIPHFRLNGYDTDTFARVRTRRFAIIICFLFVSSCSSPHIAVKSQQIRVDDGTTLHVDRRGQGPTVILVPGWTFGGQVFEKQIGYFSGYYDVITIDPRGQGRSTKSAAGNSYVQHGKDLAAILDELKVEKVTMLGWSWGCFDVFAYVRYRGTSNIQNFICVDSAPIGPGKNQDDWSMVSSLSEAAGIYQTIAADRENFIPNFITSLTTESLNQSDHSRLADMSRQTPDYVAVALAADGMFSDFSDEARQIDAAVQSLYMIRSAQQEIASLWINQNLPRTEVHVVEGHFPFWESPAKFNRTIHAFISSSK